MDSEKVEETARRIKASDPTRGILPPDGPVGERGQGRGARGVFGERRVMIYKVAQRYFRSYDRAVAFARVVKLPVEHVNMTASEAVMKGLDVS